MLKSEIYFFYLFLCFFVFFCRNGLFDLQKLSNFLNEANKTLTAMDEQNVHIHVVKQINTQTRPKTNK